MIVKNISKDNLICSIELTAEETRAILHSLTRSSCSGEQLTVSIELEGKLIDVIKNATP